MQTDYVWKGQKANEQHQRLYLVRNKIEFEKYVQHSGEHIIKSARNIQHEIKTIDNKWENSEIRKEKLEKKTLSR